MNYHLYHRTPNMNGSPAHTHAHRLHSYASTVHGQKEEEPVDTNTMAQSEAASASGPAPGANDPPPGEISKCMVIPHYTSFQCTCIDLGVPAVVFLSGRARFRWSHLYCDGWCGTHTHIATPLTRLHWLNCWIYDKSFKTKERHNEN